MSDISPIQSLPPVALPTPAAPNLAAPNLAAPNLAASKLAGAAATAAPAKLHQAAQDFEAIFMRQILAEARKSTMGDTLFSSDANSTFTQMQDARFADIAASRDALGLAGMIERQLGGRNQSATPGTKAGTKAAAHSGVTKITGKGAGA